VVLACWLLAQPAWAADGPATPDALPAQVIRIDPRQLQAASREVVVTDSHMTVIDHSGARVAEVISYRSRDGRLIIGLAQYDPVGLSLSSWPVDEFMYFLEGRLEIADRSGTRVIYGPGDAIVMPFGFNGTWKQLTPISKIAIGYEPPAAARTPPSSAVAIRNVLGSALRGTESSMRPVQAWSPYLKVVGPTHAKYVEVPVFRSGDGLLEVHMKRFEAVTLELMQWPVDEFMHLIKGQVEITTPTGHRERLRAGDSFVLPKGFSGTWRQLDTIDMMTVTYNGSSG
jgi:uncharacterized cupin superfamily protein